MKFLFQLFAITAILICSAIYASVRPETSQTLAFGDSFNAQRIRLADSILERTGLLHGGLRLSHFVIFTVIIAVFVLFSSIIGCFNICKLHRQLLNIHVALTSINSSIFLGLALISLALNHYFQTTLHHELIAIRDKANPNQLYGFNFYNVDSDGYLFEQIQSTVKS